MKQLKKRGRKYRPGVVRLYNHLKVLVENNKSETYWKSTDQICQWLFGALTTKNMDKTRGAIGAARKLLKESHEKFFYHTETDGYVILQNVNQHREVIKKHSAIADGYRLSADNIFQIGSVTLPELKKLFNEKQVKQITTVITNGLKNLKNQSVKARP